MFYQTKKMSAGHIKMLGGPQVARGPDAAQACSRSVVLNNLCFSTIIVIYGSPNCVLLYFVGRQLPNVGNQCSGSMIPNWCAAAH